MSDDDDIAVINGTISLYLEHANGWLPIQSSVVMCHLVEITGGYAPVNYDKGSKALTTIIYRKQWPAIVLGNTFTQGCRRYRF